MKWQSTAVGMALMALAMTGGFAEPSYRVFLKVDGIAGECTVAGHQGEIDVSTFSFGVANGAQAGLRAGGPQAQDLRVAKSADRASPLLLQAAFGGTPIASVQLACAKFEGTQVATFLALVLENVHVTGVTLSSPADTSLSRPLEDVTFSYGKITWQYVPTDDNGAAASPLSGSWDRETGKTSAGPVSIQRVLVTPIIPKLVTPVRPGKILRKVDTPMQ